MKDRILYDRIGLCPSLSTEEIKKEGKKLLLKHHPDKNLENPEESSKQFIKIKEALDILSDQQRRDEYHMIGIDILNGGSAPAAQHHPFSFPFPFPFPFQFNHTFNMPQKEAIIFNLQIDVSLLNDPEKEEKYDIIYKKNGPCELCKCRDCDGSGMMTKTVQQGIMTITSSSPCFVCNGKGMIKNNECKNESGDKHFSEISKKVMLSIKQNEIKSMIATNQNIVVQQQDHDLIIKMCGI